ncbi:hypothetical protein Tco_0803485 [Tanacetum coccineum]|uniref:Uncharacterized protein n=1 Tax=Tanacetum coccineum TaxID=301880 RepID=A0ABQ5A5F5_9ASTR
MSHFSGSTTNHSDALPPSSSPVKTSDNLEEFADELTLLKKVVRFVSHPLISQDPEVDIDEIDAFLAMKVSSNFKEGYFDSEGDSLENLPVEDSDSVQEEIDIFLVLGDLIPPGVENDDSEDEDNSTFLPVHELPNLDHQDNPSSPRPPPEPPDVKIHFKPDTAMKNDEDFNQGEIVLSLNVEDVNSFTFVIWTFLPSFTYPEDSPVILSFSSEDLIFDPGIFIFHFSYLEPVVFSMEVSYCSP